MNTKVLIGGVIGGVASFLLGWLIYGIILKDFMASNCNQCAQRPMDDMIMWAMALSCLLSGYFMAMVFGWTNTSGWMEGAQKGAIIGLFIGLSLDLGMYAMSTMFNNMNAMVVDVAASVVLNAIIGAIIGWYNAMGKQAA